MVDSGYYSDIPSGYYSKSKRPHCSPSLIMVYKGNHPQMAQQIRLVLVKYHNLPRLMVINSG